MEHKIPVRGEVDPKFTWATTDLFPTDEAWEAEIPKIQDMVQKFKGYEGKLGESGQNLLGFLRLEDDFLRIADPFVGYAMYKKDEDTRNPVYQKMAGQMQNLLLEAQEALAFFTPKCCKSPTRR